MSVIGLDIGTTGVKACAFNAAGKLLAQSYREYPLIFPQTGWIEIDPNAVLDATQAVIGEAAQQARAAGDAVKAVATSAQGEAVTPCTAEGKPLGNSIVTFDARTEKYVAWWEEKLGRQKFFETTGMPLHGMYTLPKVQWWKEAKPEVYAQAAKFLCYEDLACLAVFGLPPVIGTSLAGRAGAYSLKSKGWATELFDLAGLDADKWATPRPAGEVVGTIPASHAGKLGLDSDVILVVGGHDQALCALGCGIDRPQRASYVTGTVECMAPVFDRPYLDEKMAANNFCVYEAALPGKYLSITFNFTGGSLLKWGRDQLWPEVKQLSEAEGTDAYDKLLRDLPEGPTDLLVLPHFTTTGTPHLDTRSAGAIVGLRLETTRAQLVKAVLEGVTYEMALNARLQKQSGIEMAEYRAIGGGAKSPTWMQIKADILGVPIRSMKNSEAGCLGGAMLGLAALGEFTSIEEACGTLAQVDATYEPDAARHTQYGERMALYEGLYPALKDTAHGLAALRS